LTSSSPSFFGKMYDNIRNVNVKVNKNLNNKNIRNRKRAGVSPVIGTTLVVAITVAMGLGLYSFASSQTKVATKSFADEATDYINYKNDRFTVTGLAFKTNDNSQEFTAYLFNNGDRTIKISDAILTDEADSSTAYTFCTSDGTISSKDLRGIVFEACGSPSFSGFNPANPAVYEVKITSENGVFQTYFQRYGN